jgi:hypothetical protein
MDNDRKAAILTALVDTARVHTDLENVYDADDNDFSWEEVKQAVKEIQMELKGITPVFDGQYVIATIIDQTPEITIKETQFYYSRSESILLQEELAKANE